MTGPVADFCADLRRRWRSSGRDLPGVARELRISRTQLYAILNGEIKRPPDWDGLVRPLIEACGGSAELDGWRQRYEVLIRVHEELSRRPAASPPVPSALPAAVAGFTGRAAELAELDATPPGGAVVVSGIPGVGKTALAVHWAARFPGGRLHADLRGADPGDVVRQFLDELGVPAERVPESPDAQFALFRSRTAASPELLVILDNADDAEQVRPLLPAGRAITVITARRPLTALVASIGARPLVLHPPAEAEAVELLQGRLDPAARDEAAAREIVAACGGLPLALALVAARARITGFGLDVLAAELRRAATRLGALDNGALRPVFAWSYEALGPAAARLFRLLGSVAGPDLAVAAAAALAGCPAAETLSLLRELTDAGLLTEHAPGRFALHDLIRVYAAELADDDRPEALIRLLDHYTHHAYHAELVLNPTRAPIPLPLGESAVGVTPPADLSAARAWLAAERAALLDALRQAKDEGLDRHAWQLGWALDTFLSEQRRWQDEGAAWAVALRAATALTDRAAAAHAHSFLALADTRRQRFAEAHDHVRHSLELAGDPAVEAEQRFTLSYVHWLQGDHDAALREANAALELFAGLGSATWEGKSARAVGWYHSILGDQRAALAHYRRALALEQRHGDRANEAVTQNCLGLSYQQLGDTEAAVEHFRYGLANARAVGDHILRAELLARIGDILESFGDAASAREHREEAYLILTELGHPQAAEVGHKLEVPRRS
jgi:tetratricopeptide (TPR) repeat protein